MTISTKRITLLFIAFIMMISQPAAIVAATIQDTMSAQSLGQSIGLGSSGDDNWGPPDYEWEPNPDLLIGQISKYNPMLFRSGTTTLGTLNEGAHVWIPMQDGTTLPFFVLAKNNSNFGTGVALASRQYTATVTYSASVMYNGSGGSYRALTYEKSAMRDYLLNRLYPDMHSGLYQYMKKIPAANSATLKTYSSASDSNPLISTNSYDPSYDYIVMTPYYSYSVDNIALLARYESHGLGTLATNEAWYQNKNDSSVVNDGMYIAVPYIGPNVMGNGFQWTSNITRGFYWDGQSQGNTVNYRMIPHILLDESTTVINGDNGPEILVNQPPNPPTITKNPSAASINYWEHSSIAYSWTATDPDGDALTYTAQITTNGGSSWTTIQDNTAGTNYTYNIPNGTTQVQIRVKASDGQEESAWTTAPATVIVYDAIKPTISHTLTPPSWTNGNVTINLSLGDTGGSQLKSLTVPAGLSGYASGGTITLSGNSSTQSFTATANGSYTFTVTDNAGNSEQHTVVVDKIERVKPTISHTLTPPSWTNGNVTINLSLGDTGGSQLKSLTVPAGLSGYASGGTITLSGNSSTQSFTATANGSYTFTVTDNAGNSEQHTVVVDKIERVKPTISHTLTPPSWTNGNVTINLSLGDTGGSQLKSLTVPAGLSGYASGGTVPLSGNSSTQRFTATANGSYTFTVTDNAGNSEQHTVVVDKIDRVDPTITVDAAVKQYHNASSTTLTATAADDSAGIESITLPNGSVVTTNPANHSITDNGTYTFSTRDQAGNQKSTDYTYTWFDRVPPVVESITFEKTGQPLQRFFAFFSNDTTISNEQVRIKVVASDPQKGTDAVSGVVSFTYSVYDKEDTQLQGWTKVDINTPPTLDAEMDGYILAYVTDAAGNNSERGKYKVLLDGTPPKLTYSTKTNGYITSDGITKEPVTVTASGQDDESGFSHFVLLETENVSDSDTMEIVYRKNGQYTFRGYDIATNYTDMPVLINNIDTTKPQITALSFEKTGNGLVERAKAFFTGEKAASNEAVKISLQYSDTPELLDAEKGIFSAESGVSTFTFSVWDHEGNRLQDAQTWPVDQLNRIPPIEFVMDGYILAYVTDAVGHTSIPDDALYQGERFPITLDNIAPEVTWHLSTNEYTNQPVTAYLTGYDADSDFSHFEVLETGEIFDGDIMEYIYQENGTFTFRGFDFAGNHIDTPITVTKIDRTPPKVESLSLKKEVPSLVDRIFRTGASDTVKVYWTASDTPEGNNAESGIKSFSFRVFDNENEPLTKWITCAQGEIPEIPFLFNGYVAAYVTDRAGNRSKMEDDDNRVSLDNGLPTITWYFNTTEFTNKDVTLYLQGEDEDSGFSHFVVLETGEIFEGDTMEYVYTLNDTVTFRGVDNVGNYVDEPIVVDWIDKTAPEILTLTFEKTGEQLQPKRSGLLSLLFKSGTISNEQVKICLEAVDNANGNDAISGVRLFSYMIKDEDGITLQGWKTVPIDEVDQLPSIDFAFTGVVRAYVTDGAGNQSGQLNSGGEGPGGNGGEEEEGTGDDGEDFPVMLDSTAPTLRVRYSTTDYTNQPVIATVEGFDEDSGFSHFLIQGSNIPTLGAEMQITFEDNGTDHVTGVDQAGNTSDILAVAVEWIDMTPPKIDVEWDEEDREDVYAPVVFTITAMDVPGRGCVSGVKGIILPNGEFVPGETAIYSAETNGVYTFMAVDHATNQVISETVLIDCIEESDNSNGGSGGNGGGTDGGSGGGGGTDKPDQDLPADKLELDQIQLEEGDVPKNVHNNPGTGR